MIYKLKFISKALKEWQKLDKEIQQQFKRELVQCLQIPLVIKDKLQGELEHCYKIKLRKVGYRLVYKMDKNEQALIVVAVGKRDRNLVYTLACKRKR